MIYNIHPDEMIRQCLLQPNIIYDAKQAPNKNSTNNISERHSVNLNLLSLFCNSIMLLAMEIPMRIIIYIR